MTPSAGARQMTSARRDEGLTIVELLVALMVFAIVSTSVVSLLLSATKLATDDRRRMAATSLATRELEIVRDAFEAEARGPTSIDVNQVVNGSPLAGGTTGAPLVVDGIPYTVTRTAQWSQMGSSAASTCDEGGSVELAYLRVKVEVTWPELKSRPPVTMDTVMTPPKGTYSAQTGHVGVKVIDATGAPFGGRTVTLTGAGGASMSETTASDGCALFSFLTPGTYSIRLSAPGYVNRAGDAAGTATAQVTAGQLRRTIIEYDRAATLQAVFVTEPGFALPSGNTVSVSLGNSALLPSGTKAVTGSGTSRTITNLWPYPAGYEAWAGACLDNDPLFLTDEDHPEAVRDLPAATAPGSTVPVSIALAPVTVTGPRDTTIQAVHAADSACPSGETLTLGGTGASGTLKTSVPFGTWTFKRSGTSGMTATLIRGDRDVTVAVP